MKKTLFLIIIVTGFFANVRAQITTRARFLVSYSDASNKPFFDQYPDLNHVLVSYKNDTISTVTLSFRQKTSALNEEIYYLTFEGDQYMLHKKYEKLRLPKATKLAIQYFEGINDRSHTGYKLETTLRRDSVDHLFSYYAFTGEGKYPEPSSRHRAKFKGDFLCFKAN